MGDVTEEDVQRGATALLPFQRAYRLPVNPEDLELMAYAVLRYARSGEASGEIMPAVEGIIAEHFAATRKMYEAMGEATQTRSEGSGAE